MLETLDIISICRKIKLCSYTTYENSKYIEEFNVRFGIVKILVGNIARSSHQPGQWCFRFSSHSLDNTVKDGQMDYIRLNISYTAGGLQRQPPTGWEKILANDTYDNGLVSKVQNSIISREKNPFPVMKIKDNIGQAPGKRNPFPLIVEILVSPATNGQLWMFPES